jgi:hypothetical protein
MDNRTLEAKKITVAANQRFRKDFEDVIEDPEAKLNDIVMAQASLERCRDAVEEYQDHLGHAAAWSGEIERLVERHRKARDAAFSTIEELEAKLSVARQQWFIGRCQRPDIDRISAAISEQRAILEDIGELDPPELKESERQSIGVPALINTYRQQFEKYHDLLNQAGIAFRELDIHEGLGDQVETTLALAIEALEEAGRSFSRSITCG